MNFWRVKLISSSNLLKLIENEKPALISLSGQFNGYPMVAKDTCDQLHIPYTYDHAGVLPGTLVYESGGQMGKAGFA